jgi:hypothetical protein
MDLRDPAPMSSGEMTRNRHYLFISLKFSTTRLSGGGFIFGYKLYGQTGTFIRHPGVLDAGGGFEKGSRPVDQH